MTGYDGVFGYRTDSDYRDRLALQADQQEWLDRHPDFDFDAEVAKQSDEWTRPTGAEGTVVTDPMLMCFSSGTTGYPKMVLHDHTLPLGHLFTGVFWHRVEDGKLHFTISDTGWMKCMWGKFYGQWFGEATLFIYDFDKFTGASNMLTTQMKATGEVMAIGRTIEESFLKAVRSVETGLCHFYSARFDDMGADELLE